MYRNFFLVICTIFCAQIAFAQDKNQGRGLHFSSVNQVGLLQGEDKPAIHLQTANGVRYKNSFAGIGVGLDYYRFKTIPVSVLAMQYFGRQKNQFFIYADMGPSYVWEKTNSTNWVTEKYSPGFYGAWGIGFKAGLKKNAGIILNAGYSYKQVNYREEWSVCLADGGCSINSTRYAYHLNRLLFRVGWLF